jgi:uncharacterized protein
MMLCDTAPLIAMFDRDDPWHARTVAAVGGLRDAMFVTTWACLTEAMHFLHRAGGWNAQDDLWRLLDDGTLHLHNSGAGEPQRIRGLMRQYADAPMDLADASLVAAAESLGLRRIFTFDRRFHAFKPVDGHFEVVG